MIRRATPGDLAAIAAVVAAAYTPWIAVIGRRPGPMDDDYVARIAAGQASIVAEGGNVIALLVTERHADHLLLDNLAVLPAAQGRGLGRRLLAEAEREAGAVGLPRIRLYTHALMASNIALYERAGFVTVARVSEKGFDRVYMERAVALAPKGTA